MSQLREKYSVEEHKIKLPCFAIFKFNIIDTLVFVVRCSFCGLAFDLVNHFALYNVSAKYNLGLDLQKV